MPVKAQKVRAQFPLKGFVESSSLSDQPPGSTPRVENVTAFDSRTGRNRGASRSGLSKFCPESISGTSPIQDINSVVGYKNANDEFILLEDASGGILLEDGSGDLIGLEGDYDTHVGDRNITLVVVAGGNVKLAGRAGTDTVLNGTGALSSVKNVIFSTPFQQDIYYTDGTNYKIYQSSSNSMIAWTPTPVTGGALPFDGTGDNNKAELICTWGGRIVLAGVRTTPRIWFMSAVEDPLNWEYSPDVITSQIAVAGTSNLSFVPADIITALVPINDDILLFGCDHSLWVMRGNPADGGRLDLRSDICGMAYGRAFCRSPEGFLYFVGGRGGIYKMDPDGGIPQRLTANTIDERLADIVMDMHQFILAWDDRHVGVRVFVTKKPVDGVVQNSDAHFFWDVRNEAWWIVRFRKKEHNPLCCYLMDGPDPQDRAILLGCQDGYLRNFDVDAVTDDGQPIESEVWFGPYSDLTLLEMTAVLSSDSGNVNWSIHTAAEFDTALDDPPTATGTWRAGSNSSEWPRRYISSGYVKLASNEPWSLERLDLLITPASEQQQRAMR